MAFHAPSGARFPLRCQHAGSPFGALGATEKFAVLPRMFTGGPAWAACAVSGVFGLPQEGAGGLLEDAAPGAGALLLGLEVPDDLAHAGGRDLDPVLRADSLQPVVVLGQLERDRLEAV